MGASFRLVTAPPGATSTLSESGLWLGCFVFVPLGTCGRFNRALKLSWLQTLAWGLNLLVSWWSVEGFWINIPARLLHWSPGWMVDIWDWVWYGPLFRFGSSVSLTYLKANVLLSSVADALPPETDDGEPHHRPSPTRCCILVVFVVTVSMLTWR